MKRIQYLRSSLKEEMPEEQMRQVEALLLKRKEGNQFLQEGTATFYKGPGESNHSSAVNGDKVVFKSIDDLMRRQSVKPLRGVRPYFKDDLTNYSKAQHRR